MVSNNKLKAFTLVELAIVIVIIGLIVGGIVAGQSVVKQVKLRSITTDMGTYESAYNSFVLQYNWVPGDMTNAYDFWGNGGAVCSNNYVVNVPGGCNGNGDGKVVIAAYITDQSVHGEEVRAWQFLALSGLLPGSYSGATGHHIIGNNVPPSHYSPTVGVTFRSPSQYARYTDNNAIEIGLPVPNLNRSNYVIFGTLKLSNTGTNGVAGPFLTTAEAYALDSKIDNGLPQNGKFIAYTGQPDGPVADHCASDNGGASNFYILTHNTIACTVAYRMPK